MPQGIASGALSRGVALTAVESSTSTQGLGVQGVVDGHAVVAGRERFLADWAITLPDELRAAKDAAEGDGRTPILVGWDRSEEHTSALQSLMRISYAVFCLKKTNYY